MAKRSKRRKRNSAPDEPREESAVNPEPEASAEAPPEAPPPEPAANPLMNNSPAQSVPFALEAAVWQIGGNFAQLRGQLFWLRSNNGVPPRVAAALEAAERDADKLRHRLIAAVGLAAEEGV